MKRIKLTMAQALLKFLDNQYVELDGKVYKFVKGVFGIFGHGNVLGIAEALENMNDLSLKFYQGHNEQGMVHAATAYAKQKNRLEIFACTSSIGPGALNMITAAATATVNRIPVLLLPGDIFASRQPDPVLQQLELPNNYKIVANDAFKSVSKYWDRIERPEQLMTAAINAMRVLTDPVETGAVTLALPQDVQGEVYEYPKSFFEKRTWTIERRQPNPKSLEKAIKLILNKKKPLIIAGGGIHYSFAYDELKEFAEAFNIPIGFTQAGKGIFTWDHPLNMGGIGTTGTLAANILAKEADLVIAIGTRLMDFTTASKTQFQNSEVEILSINVSRFDGIKMDSTLLLSDAKLALKELKEVLEKHNYKTSYKKDYIFSLKNEWKNEVDRLYSLESKKGIVQTKALGVINEFLNENDIIVGAAGSLPGDLHRLWRCKGRKTYHLEYGFSCMGYEVAGSYGVKLAEPEKEVWTMISDGSYIMLHSELVSTIQERKKINIIMFDNGGFQSINSLQKGHGSENGFGNELRYRNPETNKLDGDYMNIDFAKNAESYGAKSYVVDSIEKLKKALKDAKKSKISTLIHIKILPGTQSSGYESFWRVGIAHHSENKRVIKVQKEHDEYLQKYAKDY
ncbi:MULTISPECIES: 3D-(3,5/4)-trihydroxycyclohexane-1,2-dione acylhydrolase (decyclizing) [unclassified Marinitoga]|uniref:3D-(3,5/4)-trihydroxycyclohexane-1,2-dione acylhydrolase (decyclizing) n=1 Tax=unclassified Marinitoga TaxID=2640159 RepID=UPI0006416ECD|nr:MULTISPECIES: 3D-(3,5/4)-trihydroxycyclohexane-1,2-dione acylhydrolase (decyclizing) [unclassified Marinitoga]KLO24606.1 3D-(3,5/4)-trihydroxycyclohexane-1,2-dione hydrolase [Marinitoga sp. 1155]NUU98867.1 3D-(3,5/4)-trihydroxycyclohexane-1,2-dione hydrolase [Marinitoga sp. 1154]